MLLLQLMTRRFIIGIMTSSLRHVSVLTSQHGRGLWIWLCFLLLPLSLWGTRASLFKERCCRSALRRSRPLQERSRLFSSPFALRALCSRKNKTATLSEHTSTSVLAAILRDIYDDSDTNFIYTWPTVSERMSLNNATTTNDRKNTLKQTKHLTKSQLVYKQTHDSRHYRCCDRSFRPINKNESALAGANSWVKSIQKRSLTKFTQAVAATDFSIYLAPRPTPRRDGATYCYWCACAVCSSVSFFVIIRRKTVTDIVTELPELADSCSRRLTVTPINCGKNYAKTANDKNKAQTASFVF